ncbi:mechanosensitive ion channel family protein [Agarivorans albus]|uniref:Potassium efflux system KefA protein n=1 Tax=Agarivorans albus MKT 106 TaxID=1331007 RepID=R9PP09_AGAAL|nr:mechanosensitive ion channel family protein [Agarivorans albus]GAD03132.1 potassium efflux system KefA protein [Agarivorans albus MKT 106]
MTRLLIAITLLSLSVSTMASAASTEDPVSAQRSIDLSSPQQTLDSFLRSSKQVISAWRSEQFNSLEGQIAFYQASKALDLSTTANRNRNVVVMEKIVLLREILNRIESRESVQFTPLPADEAGLKSRWRISGTDLIIEKQLEGFRAGQYLFSALSVNRLSHQYFLFAISEKQNLAHQDLYQEFILNPGPLLSRSLVMSLPAWSQELLAGLPIWQWIMLLSMSLVSFKAIRFSFLLGQLWNARFNNSKRHWQFGKQLALIFNISWMMLFSKIIDDGIWLYGMVYQISSSLILSVQFVLVAWFVLSIFIYIAILITTKKYQDTPLESSPDSSLILVLAKILGGITIVLLGLYVLEFMGVSISPLVAGLGVGGLAIALAIRPLLENLINGLTLYADGGIKIGELCRYGDKNLYGVIENIGLRATRIRTLERSVITIPNSEFANMEIDNLERRDRRRMEHILKLRPEISVEQLQVLLVNLRRDFLRHPKVEEEPTRVRFMGLGSYSLNVSIVLYIRCRDHDEFMALQEDLLFMLYKAVDQVGAKLAFSTQHQYAGKLKTIEAEQVLKAQQTVQKWHDEESFPFPNFSYSYRYEIKDTSIFPVLTSAVRKDSQFN